MRNKKHVFGLRIIGPGFLGTVIGFFFLSFLSNAQTTTLTVGGKTRNMIVYAPAGIAQNRPLIIQMHGYNQDAGYQKAQAKWEPIADTGKFIVAFPNGINRAWDISGNSDIDFILAIIDNLYTKYGIDKSRVYLSGFSMGGFLTYHAMGKIADKIAAFAPVSGSMGGNFTSSRPIPILHTHGDADGGYSGLTNLMSGWSKRNNGPTTPKITKPYPANKPNSTTTKYSWGPGDCQTEVVLMSLAGKGHWYSTDIANGTHTSVEIWNFCKRYTTSCGVVSSTNVALTSPENNSSFTAPASITLNATASKTGGSISRVEFYNGTLKLGEDVSSPYSYSWSNVAKGSYTVTAVATDNSGTKTTSSPITIKINVPQGPYNGIVHQIPGTIQLEEYDLGGSGVAYNDASPGNTGGASIRTDEDVDLETCTDVGGGYNIGFATAGEWLEYSTNVANAGLYDIDLRVACNGEGRTLLLSMNGSPIGGTLSVPNTGAWQTWTTVTIKGVQLMSGPQILKMTMGASDYVNINYIQFRPSGTTGLESIESAGIQLYPNPFHAEGIHINNGGEFSYRINNMSGILIEEGNGSGSKKIGQELPSGIYLLTVKNEKGMFVQKMIRQ